MDRIKLLFYINVVLLCSVPIKANSLEKEKETNERKVNFNHKLKNSTRDAEETLLVSPSEHVLHNRSLFRENKRGLPVNQNQKTSKNKTDKKSNNETDLTGEANIYSPVLTFTEAPLRDHWHIVPEIFPYTPQYKFPSPLPIIESQSFVNTPKWTYIRNNPKPAGNLQGRNVHSSSEYSDDHSSYNHQRHPEPESHPGRGHAVHTETVHDFGRFLPPEYKSKIEKEAELLIKQKKTDNTTVASATTNRPQEYTIAPESHSRGNRQSARRYPHQNQRPINTSFFHKGNFESAYPFPDDNVHQDGRKHLSASGGHTPNPNTEKIGEPVTPIKIGEPYNHNIGVTSTEIYHQDYSYPPEQSSFHGSPYNVDSYQKNPHLEAPPLKDTHVEDSHQRDQYNRDVYHKNQQLENPNYRQRKPVDPHYKNQEYENHNFRGRRPLHNHHKGQQYENPTDRDRKLGDNHHEDPYQKDVKHNNQPHVNSPLPISHDQNHHHNNGFHSNTFRNPNHGYVHHNDPYHNDPHHASPPNAPIQYGPPTEIDGPTYPDIHQKPVSNHPESVPYTSQPYSQPEHQNLPQQYHNGENKLPGPYNTEFYQPDTDIPQKTVYSNLPSKINPPSSDSSKYNKNPEVPNATNRPLEKSPLQSEIERPYYNSFKSLVDLYKSFGFQPLDLDEMPILPARYPFENPFYGKLEVSSPLSSYGPDNDFIRPSKPPTYTGNTSPPTDQNPGNHRNQYSIKNYGNKEVGPNPVNYREPYANTKYNIKENGPSSIGGPASTTNHVSGENGPSSVSYGAPQSYTRYNSGENGPSSVSYGGPHANTKYNSGENGPSSLNYNGPHSNIKYNSGENGPSSVSYGRQHYDMKYNSKENYPYNSYKHTSSDGNMHSQYPEHVPYDTHPSPAVSTEFYDPPEISQPHHALNTQIETPKALFKEGGYEFKPHSYSTPATYSPPEEVKPKGIRIKDYDAETYFGAPPQTHLDTPPQSELNSGAFPPTNTTLYSHSIVRNNPYNIKSPYLEEVEETYRPRTYRQKLKIEIDPSVEVSDERPNPFQSNDNINKFSSSLDAHTRDGNHDYSRDIEPYNTHAGYQENEHGVTKSKERFRSTNRNQQRRPTSKRKSKSHQADKNGDSNSSQEYRHSKKKKSSKRHYEDKLVRSPLDQDYPSSRHSKRSSHRSARKHRSSDNMSPENMRAEGSTYRWGMERHKGLDGFFQYANVPGAKAFEFGYRMGGPEHKRERHHKTIGEQSKIKVNWEDRNGDSGDHYWEFNHNTNENEENDEKEEVDPKSKPQVEESSEESSN